MLTIQPLDAQGRAENGSAVLHYLLATEYYVDAEGVERCPSAWIGEGARQLGLASTVEQAAMLALASGYAPDGRALVQNAGKADKKLGYDLTFSVDKSVSILFAAASPAERERILAAHHAACGAALDFLRGQVTTRRGHGGREVIPVAGFVIARFDHFASREIDVQLHSHHFVPNVALGDDGRFASFDQKGFMLGKHAAGALYRAELATRLRALGYAIRSERERDADGRDTGEVWHRVAGIDENVLDTFSKRRAQIEQHMAQTGSSAQAACLATRRNKDEPTFNEVMAITARTLDGMRANDPQMFRHTDELKVLASTPLRGADHDVLTRLHLYESSWTKADLIEALAKELGGQMSARQIQAEAESFVLRNELVDLMPDRHGQARWASQAQVDMERRIVEQAKARQHDQTVRLDAAIVAKAIADTEQEKGITLTDEQKHAVHFVTTDSAGVACLSGRAGAGKTSVARAIVQAYAQSSRIVIGTTLSWSAAEKLAVETGLDTSSIALLLSRLDKKRIVLTDQSVILVDEAGMVGAPTISRLQRYCDEAKAKLVLVGDCMQLQPIETTAFKLVIGSVGDAALTEIRRQRHAEDRELAAMFYQDGVTGEQLVEAMRRRGQLQTEAYRPQLVWPLVEDWLADTTTDRDKLVIAGTNAQCDALTAALRKGLKSQGRLTQAQTVTVRGERLRQQKLLELAVGDRIRFGKRDRTMRVSNNTQGIITAIEAVEGGHRLRVRLESDVSGQDERVVDVDTRKYNALRYGWVSTVYSAQGQQRSRVYWLAEGKAIDRNLGLVAFTRQQEAIRIYATHNPDGETDGVRSLAHSLDRWREKSAAIELLAKRRNVRLERVVAPAFYMARKFASVVRSAMQVIRHAASRQTPLYKHQLEVERALE